MNVTKVSVPTVTNVRCVPANEATEEDLDAVFGVNNGDYCSRCRCQRFKVPGWFWRDSTLEERIQANFDQAACGIPDAPTSGLVAYVDGEPAGWVAVEPRLAYPKLLRGTRIPWTGRNEDKDDPGVWAVTCLIVRRGFRGRGLTYDMARATIDYARSHGATALEAYPMITEPGKEITWGELHVGARQAFEEAGFVEVHHPTKRRVVMRVDFERSDDLQD